MIVNNLGYIFECRSTATGKSTGVMCKYNISYNFDTTRLEIICGIDSFGNIVVPSRLDYYTDFESLKIFCETSDDIHKFVKSNKPYFVKLGEFAVLAAGALIFKKDSLEIINTENFGFYVPLTVSNNVEQITDNRGRIQPALICEKFSTKKGLNTFTVSDAIYDGYYTTFKNAITEDFLKGREIYLSTLVLGSEV